MKFILYCQQVERFGGTTLKYALLGDLHSDKKKTETVLTHIQEIAPDAEIIGLGDLCEATIGKKKAEFIRNVPLKDAALYDETFEKLLTFPSVIGNQEERIALVTGEARFLNYPEEIHIQHATIIHGHQFHWNENFEPTFPTFKTPLVFFGHSHRAAIYINGVRTAIQYNVPIDVRNQQYIMNVGAVLETKDWCLYDSDAMTVTFLQA